MLSLLIGGLVTVLITSTSILLPSSSTEALSNLIVVAEAQAPTVEDVDPFMGYPELKAICSCESGLRHIDETTGEVLRGRVNSSDIGICQINEYYNEKRINAWDIDIYTFLGNVNFAKRLYELEGMKPWVHSKSCWESKI